MALVMTPIYTRVLDNNNTSTVTFNNIPQVYTDLKIEISSRSSRSDQAFDNITFTFNSDTSSVYSDTLLYGIGSSATSLRNSNNNRNQSVVYQPTNFTTSNTFGNATIYVPNYTGSNFKSCTGDSNAENNSATANILALGAGLWRNTAAVTSLQFSTGGAFTFIQNSTFSLYGIIRSGA